MRLTLEIEAGTAEAAAAAFAETVGATGVGEMLLQVVDENMKTSWVQPGRGAMSTEDLLASLTTQMDGR